MRHPIIPLLGVLVTFSSCSIGQSLQRNATRLLITPRNLRHAYVGICVYDPVKGKYLYEHNDQRFFTPASNTKLYTFYTGLTLLGDSTTGIQYQVQNDTLYIRGTGDPSLLHPDFPVQPAFRFLANTTLPIVLVNPVDENKIFGPGWSWDDYNEDYQPERSAMPLYGNVAWFTVENHELKVMPKWFARVGDLHPNKSLRTRTFFVRRDAKENRFDYTQHVAVDSQIQQVPFIVEEGVTTAALLEDTLHKPVVFEPDKYLPENTWNTIRNVPLDSLFRHMMYRSDNFFAEQTAQMSSMKLWDTISTARINHYMLNHQLNDLPDPPHWVDGSGLSRYNLFTPRDMVSLLNKLYGEFPHERIDSMLPTGGKGTLASLYHDMSGSIFAKTGSLSNDVALSGYLVTQKGRTLIFSILINHCVYSLQGARLAMEAFLRRIWTED